VGEQMRVENDYANQLLIGIKKGQCLHKFMDAVSGVENYKISDLRRQGVIRGAFSSEIIADQFILNLDDIISVFWTGVFSKIPDTKLYKEMIIIKDCNGNTIKRPTNKNPIHFLRSHGIMTVRNHINSLYRKNLQQYCNVCGYKCSIRNSKICSKCKNEMIVTYRFANIEDTEIGINDEIPTKDIAETISNLLHEFAYDVLKPGTRAFQILNILTNPEASIEMCKICKLCDRTTFDIDHCTNYNANISNWLGVNKAMIASKVGRIRKALPKFLSMKCSEGSIEAQYLLDIIPKRFRQNN
jgi:hypothetical protein